MQDHPKVSVIIPVFNTAEYLPRCLDSVLRNTYRNLEVICVNDGSTDDSAAILERYAAEDSRMVVIHKANEGVSAARNTGLDLATGNYIAFIDSDDWVHSLYFEILLSFAKEKCANVVCCKELRTSSIVDDAPVDVGSIECSAFSVSEAFANRNTKCCVWGRLYAKEIVGKHVFNRDMRLSEDTVFNSEVMCDAPELNLILLDVALYYYFSRPDSLVHTLNARVTEPVIRWYCSRAKKTHSDEIRVIYLFEAFKMAFSYRYGVMFEQDYRTLKACARSMIMECLAIMRTQKNITLIKKLQYSLLSIFPFIYRAFRIIDDRTLLDWEREQKRKRQIESKMK